MGWEPDRLYRTLFIEKDQAGDRRNAYRNVAFMQVERLDDSFIALEPVPALTSEFRCMDIWNYDEVKFIDPVCTDRSGTRGPLGLTNKGSKFAIRTSLENK